MIFWLPLCSHRPFRPHLQAAVMRSRSIRRFMCRGCHADLRRGACNANGSDERSNSALLLGEDMVTAKSGWICARTTVMIDARLIDAVPDWRPSSVAPEDAASPRRNPAAKKPLSPSQIPPFAPSIQIRRLLGIPWVQISEGWYKALTGSGQSSSRLPSKRTIRAIHERRDRSLRVHLQSIW